jgi:2-oxoglutarate ferredoxin oxidoreductase subunit delta
MAKGEIVINEAFCKGCGLCVEFCPRDCTAISDRFNSNGFFVAEFAHPDKCTACQACAWMCPETAIEVYRFVEEESSSA